MLISKTYSKPQSFSLGQRLVVNVNGNFRPLNVVGILANRKAFLFQGTFGE